MKEILIKLNEWICKKLNEIFDIADTEEYLISDIKKKISDCSFADNFDADDNWTHDKNQNIED